MSGSKIPNYGKPVTDKVKQAIRNTHNIPVFLYNSKTRKLIQKYNSQKELIADLKVSSKTILKYKDSGKYLDLNLLFLLYHYKISIWEPCEFSSSSLWPTYDSLLNSPITLVFASFHFPCSLYHCCLWCCSNKYLCAFLSWCCR